MTSETASRDAVRTVGPTLEAGAALPRRVRTTEVAPHVAELAAVVEAELHHMWSTESGST